MAICFVFFLFLPIITKIMRHITIDYGIDLGTTNSSICRMSEGIPTIIRSDNGMETMPSCVSFKKNGNISVGYSAFSDLGNSRLRALKRKSIATTYSCIEFKRYMGSDKSYSYADHNWSPEELSAEVLKTLCSFVTDDEVKSAVITVPAKFTVNQKDATLQAAHLAGIDQVELIQEPIAASMAYGLKAEDKNGIWMVFDFGGGTLDVALVHVTDGIMQVFDTEGDNYLGGKNLDEAIVSKILLPELTSRFVIDLSNLEIKTMFTDALKVVAEKLKNSLSYKDSETVCLEAGDWGEDADGEEIELDIEVTRKQVESAIEPILQKAVDVCKTLMIRNNIGYDKLSHLILIGGPTYIPLLRKMLREQVTQNVETRIDPMTAVAQGASIFASTLPVKRDLYAEDMDTDISLDVEFEGTSVEMETYVTVKPPRCEDNLEVSLIRRSDGWSSGYSKIGEKGGLVIAELLPNMPNVFRISAKIGDDEVRCFPSEITIVQGTKTGSAILPYNIGIEVFNPKRNKRVFTALTGLEKNRPLPAHGTVYGLKTMADIHGGDEMDNLRIAIYQGDDNAEGKTAALYEYVSDVLISGDDIASYIPEGSHLNVEINVDRSEMMSVVCEFPQSGQRVEKRLDTSKRQSDRSIAYLQDLIYRAYTQLRELTAELGDSDISLNLLHQIKQVEGALNAGGQSKQIEQHIKEVMRKLEEYSNDSEWELCLAALQRAFFSLQIEAAKRSDNEVAKKITESFGIQVERMIALKDERKAKYLQHQIEEYEYALCQADIYRNYIRNADANFSSIKWTNGQRAQQLVIEGMAILNKDPHAPLEHTRVIVETLLSLIKRKKVRSTDSSSGSAETSGGTGRLSKYDIPSM